MNEELDLRLTEIEDRLEKIEKLLESEIDGKISQILNLLNSIRSQGRF